MQKALLFVVFCCQCFFLLAQDNAINPKDVTIVRDQWGVPHIYGKTDADAAYGLAWAYAEDDFESLQQTLLAAQGMLGRIKGIKGAIFDYALAFLSIDSIVESRFEQDLSPEYRKVLAGYVQGVNDYAASHPKEILYKKAFPIVSQDVIKGYVLSTTLMAGLGMALKAVKEDRIQEFYNVNDRDIGSNAMAVAPHRMADNKGFLLVNSHQPHEGRFAWYEAHVSSEEGWDMIGATFAGGTNLFIGANRHLGWAHTNNYHNFGDIYKLQINPKNKKQYKYDGEWRDFYIKKAKLVVKIIGIPIRVSKKVWVSEYGPVFKTKRGMFAFRFGGTHSIQSAEQWFKMNKATNLKEFEEALKMQALPLFNVVYGDMDGNIMLHSGGIIPLRDTSLDWRYPIQATSSAYKWKKTVPYERIPTVKNPKAGFVYNANNTPLHATADDENWDDYFVGLQLFDYNRGQQLGRMLKSEEGKFTEQRLYDIKFNTAYAEEGAYRTNFAAFFNLSEEKYPKIADAIRKMKNWNMKGGVDNKDAALAMVAHDFLRVETKSPFGLLMIRRQKISEEEAVWALTKAKRLLKRTHGTIDVPLGEVQRYIRGDKSLPADGLREVLRATDTKLYKKSKGIYRVTGGDCYFQFVRFTPEGPEIKSINAYGSSAREDSPHYNDQMEYFAKHKMKPMTFDKEEILKNAERKYHPLPHKP